MRPGTPDILFLGSEIYRNSRYARYHPLSIPRVSTVIDLARAQGWLPDELYRDSPMASPAELARFHSGDYIQALLDAERDQGLDPERRRRFNLGGVENPISPEIYSRPATSCGASLYAVRLLQDVDTIYSPAGGTHHGRPDRASGFCYLNDPVLCILALLDAGVRRVAYVDLDAHHGDGVQDALSHDPRVLIVSVHEEGRWPKTGTIGDRGGGGARNLPVPRGFHDAEMREVSRRAIQPLLTGFAPEALVVQGGADAVSDDPLSKLDLSNQALWSTVQDILPLAPKRIVLGGGGYNPWTVARCWTGIWGAMTGQDNTAPITNESKNILAGLAWDRRAGRDPKAEWLTGLADATSDRPVRPEIVRVIASVFVSS